MNKKARLALSLTVLVGLILLAIRYIFDNFHIFKEVSIVNPVILPFLAIILLINLLVTGIMNAQPLHALGVNLKLAEEFKLAIVTRFYNLITPFRGGMAARALYLKNKYDFSYTNFLATLAASYVLIFLVSSLLGLISAWLIFSQTGIFSSLIFFIFLGIFIAVICIILFSPTFKETKYSWINRFIKVINGWNLIKNNKRVIIVTVLASIMQLLLGALMLYYQFRVFGFETSFVSCLFLTSIGSLGIIIAITPAGLGIQEAITVFSAATIGISPAQSLSASLIGRLVSVVVLFILGPIFSYILLKRKPTNERKN